MRDWSFSASAEWVVGALLVVVIVAALVRLSAACNSAAPASLSYGLAVDLSPVAR